jgi:Fe-S-cluster containining protein
MSSASARSKIDIPLAELLAGDQRLTSLADAAFVSAAYRAGDHLVCHPGCDQCCHGAFAISPLDALRLRVAMEKLAATDLERAQAVAIRAAAYREQYSAVFPGDPESGILGATPEAEAAFEDFANDEPCPALDPASGCCDLYEARPMTCRTFGPPVRHASEAGEGFAVCELCFTDACPEEIEEAEMKPPLAEEQALLTCFAPGSGETVVAWCLALPSDRPIAV